MCVYGCAKNRLEIYYAQYLQFNKIDIQNIHDSNNNESSYSAIIVDAIDELSQSEYLSEDVMFTNRQSNKREKLKGDIKQILGKLHENKINDIYIQIDELFDNVLEKEIVNYMNDYKYVIKCNKQQIQDILSTISFICRLAGKSVEEDKILEIKQLIFKTIINKCVEMYNSKNRKLLNISMIEKIKHFKNLVKLGNILEILPDNNREFGNELKDFCKVSYLNERLKMNGDDIKVKINSNTYEIIKDNTSEEIKKSNKEDVFTKIQKIDNNFAVRFKVDEIDILSRIVEVINEIDNRKQTRSIY